MSASQYCPARATSSPRTEPFEYFGCGWFESSWELSRGVQVQEDLSIEEFELFVLAQSLPRQDIAAATQ